jgi:outer membrane protein TolC
MRLDLYFRPFWPSARVAALAVALSGFGMPLSAFGQPPAQPPTSPTPTPLPAMPSSAATIVQGTPISIDDAVRMALENNLGVQAERLNPQIAVLGVAQARGAWAPALFSSTTKSNATSPPTDFNTTSASGLNEIQTTGNFVTQGGIQQVLKWGTSYTLGVDGSRTITNQTNAVFNPQLGSHLNFSATQPLLRNFSIDGARQQYLQAVNREQTADLVLQQRVVQTARDVRGAYYNLLGAIAGLDVAQQSLDLAREQLKQNQTRVEVGTMAPIDIVAAQAEVASNEEAVIIRQAAIETAQDQLRALVMNPSQSGFWTTRFAPTEQPALNQQSIDIDSAVKNALEHRTDILQFKKQMESTDITRRYASNQKLPQVDLQGRYGLVGIGGSQLNEDRLTSTQRSFSDTLRDVFGNNYRTWSLTLNVSYPIGTSPADALYASAKLQHQQEVTALADLETQVTLQVRDAGRQVATNLRRVEATRKARELAEKRLEAEQKRFQVGLNSTFELFQAQRDLANARNAELNATIAYNQSLVDFEAVQNAPIR